MLQATADLDKTRQRVNGLTLKVAEGVRGLARRSDAVESEFGVRLIVEVGAVLSRTAAEGHLNVKASLRTLEKKI